jgi:hypothetical protein
MKTSLNLGELDHIGYPSDLISSGGYSGTATITGTTGVCTTNLFAGPSTSNSFNNGQGLMYNSPPTAQPNSTLIISNQNNMTPKQVHVAVFTITRDVDTNEINSTKFLKELWVEQKNGTSIDLLVAKQLGNDFDPETTLVKIIYTVSF